jgi:ectoine hydroxylase-related dioxygenase (phytanoyl-CoA dioxygenase family)
MEMNNLAINNNVRRLSADEKQQFEQWGYIKNLPVFDDSAVAELQAFFREVADRLPPGIDISRINNWHKASRKFFQLCRTPAILNYVEDLIGTNFFQWGGQFFAKYPNDGSVVPWHQDAQYWPLTPHRTVTVWLALYDTDDSNAAMQVVRGSHRRGTLRHHQVSGDQYVLEQEADPDQIDPSDIVTLDLKAGEISLHDDGLLHGSGPNNSEYVRCGLTMRYCPTEVKCDLNVWPTFETYMARGIDAYNHNPVGKVPDGEGFPVRRFQSSADFV